MKAANRIVLNTGVLYARMVVTVGISLYSTRLILDSLGSTDYGINNLIAGVVAMLSFLNVAMATSTQRYLSFYRGKGDLDMQKKVFSNSLSLHIAIGLIIVAGLQIASFFLFDGFLNIPQERIPSAKTVYHLMSVTVFFTIIAVPFTASLIGHENMVWMAMCNILETILKLVVALLLPILVGDKLIIYGFFVAGISLIIFLLNTIFCLRNYSECTLTGLAQPNKALSRELTSFAGWNLFGSLCGLARSQGLAILLNLFFGAAINAAFGIANQVGAQLKFFSASMLRVTNPQIMMSEGANNRDRMLRLSMTASKFGFFLFAFIAIPCIFEMPNLLNFWLKKVPANTVDFSRLILLGALINQLTIGLQSAAQATGKIKAYQAVVGGTLLLNIPIAYLLLKIGLPAYSVIITYAFIEAIACSLRVFFLKKLANMSVNQFLRRVIYMEILPIVLVCLTCYLIAANIEWRFRFLISIAASTVVLASSTYLFGLCKDEKEVVNALFVKIHEKLSDYKIFSKFNKKFSRHSA